MGNDTSKVLSNAWGLYTGYGWYHDPDEAVRHDNKFKAMEEKLKTELTESEWTIMELQMNNMPDWQKFKAMEERIKAMEIENEKKEQTKSYENKLKAMEEKIQAMEIENEKKKKKEQTESEKKKIEEEMTNILKAGLDPGMWDLLQFIESQGQDTSDIKNNIAHLLTHHKIMNYHALSRELESRLSIHQPFNDMTKAISIALNTGLLSLPNCVTYDQSLEKSIFTLEVGKIAAAVTAATTAVATAGGILAAVLGKLKDIDFFSKRVETHTCGNQSLSIVEVMSNSNSKNAVALIEIARVSVSLRNEKGCVVFAGAEAVNARVGVYYGRGTVALKDLFPQEEERCQVIAELQTAAEQRRQFLKHQYMKRNNNN